MPPSYHASAQSRPSGAAGMRDGSVAAVKARQDGRGMQAAFGFLFLTAAMLLLALPLRAADRDRVAAFISITGYDVVIESLQLGAASAPAVAGDGSDEFGAQYADLAREVFDPKAMIERATDLLAASLSDELLHIGAEFYASDLGQRMVEVENRSHVERYAVTPEARERAVIELLRNPMRRRAISVMAQSIGNEDMSLAGLVEIQARFILAARSAGAEEMDLSERELRQRLMQMARARLPEMRREALQSTAWTYRDVPLGDLSAYIRVLRSREFRALYDVLNKVQYQVMIDFYEKLGLRLAEITPERDL